MRSKNKYLLCSFKNSFTGFYYCLRTQRNFRIHLVIAILVLGFACFLKIEKIEILILFFTIILVLILEIINTAVETLIDLVVPDWTEKARIVKDVAAAAVLAAAIGSVIVGVIIFSPYISLITNH